jgi:hypothetical protein
LIHDTPADAANTKSSAPSPSTSPDAKHNTALLDLVTVELVHDMPSTDRVSTMVPI